MRSCDIWSATWTGEPRPGGAHRIDTAAQRRRDSSRDRHRAIVTARARRCAQTICSPNICPIEQLDVDSGRRDHCRARRFCREHSHRAISESQRRGRPRRGRRGRADRGQDQPPCLGRHARWARRTAGPADPAGYPGAALGTQAVARRRSNGAKRADDHPSDNEHRNGVAWPRWRGHALAATENTCPRGSVAEAPGTRIPRVFGNLTTLQLTLGRLSGR